MTTTTTEQKISAERKSLIDLIGRLPEKAVLRLKRYAERVYKEELEEAEEPEEEEDIFDREI
ncbi:MAG: hypothetical protein LBR61_05950 [Synergistaceae bacterium]|jgi:hypothetical protein|nr:hypothetical protein [Synergistaceae bacterium]